jgi:ribulose-5-phosphate 4-epimerase/fuculose-1-phosphate aldolase
MDAAGHVREALARVARKGLSGEHAPLFSVRIPGQSAMAAGSDPEDIATISYDQAEGEAALHAGIYRMRGDAGAVLTARQPWASRLAQMPSVFDEQARQLGPCVERYSVATLKTGANAFLMDQGVLVIGFTAERAVLNVELLEKCAKAYLLATLAGGRIATIPWFVRWIAGRRLRRDQRSAAAAYARGEVPAGFSIY